MLGETGREVALDVPGELGAKAGHVATPGNTAVRVDTQPKELAVKKAPINNLRNAEWAGGGLRHRQPFSRPVTRIIDSRAARS